MREFFRGWRRKIGVVTLIISCLAVAGWARSTFTADCARFAFGKHRTIAIWSESQSFGWFDLKTRYGYTKIPRPPSWYSNSPHTFTMFDTTEMKWQRNVIGLTAGMWPRYEGDGTQRILSCPYWLAVLPLTLISAWLLLAQPRSRGRVPSVEVKVT